MGVVFYVVSVGSVSNHGFNMTRAQIRAFQEQNGVCRHHHSSKRRGAALYRLPAHNASAAGSVH